MTQLSPNLVSVFRNSHDCVGFLRSALPTTLAASDSDGGLGVEDIKRTEGAGAASSHSLPNSGARCLSCRQSPIIKKQASQLIAGVIASRKTGDQQQ